MIHARHHISVRKRKNHHHKKLSKKTIKLIDTLVIVTGYIGIISSVDQAYKVWSTQSAEGISLLAWGSFVLYASIFLLYGIVHRERSIIITQIGSLTVFSSVLIGILIYS